VSQGERNVAQKQKMHGEDGKWRMEGRGQKKMKKVECRMKNCGAQRSARPTKKNPFRITCGHQIFSHSLNQPASSDEAWEEHLIARESFQDYRDAYED